MLPNNFNSLNTWLKNLEFSTVNNPFSREKLQNIYRVVSSWKDSDLEFGGGNVTYTPSNLVSLLKIRAQSSKKALGFEESINYLEKLNNNTQITHVNYVRHNNDSLLWSFFDKDQNVVSLVFISEQIYCAN